MQCAKHQYHLYNKNKVVKYYLNSQFLAGMQLNDCYKNIAQIPHGLPFSPICLEFHLST